MLILGTGELATQENKLESVLGTFAHFFFYFLSINFCINERLYFKIHVKIGSKNGNFHTLLVPLKMRALARSIDEVVSYHLSHCAHF